MALVIFRSKAGADITMFAESARRIFEIIGRPESATGVITVEQVPDALQRLTTAVEQDKGATARLPPTLAKTKPQAKACRRAASRSVSARSR